MKYEWAIDFWQQWNRHGETFFSGFMIDLLHWHIGIVEFREIGGPVFSMRVVVLGFGCELGRYVRGES